MSFQAPPTRWCSPTAWAAELRQRLVHGQRGHGHGYSRQGGHATHYGRRPFGRRLRHQQFDLGRAGSGQQLRSVHYNPAHRQRHLLRRQLSLSNRRRLQRQPVRGQRRGQHDRRVRGRQHLAHRHILFRYNDPYALAFDPTATCTSATWAAIRSRSSPPDSTSLLNTYDRRCHALLPGLRLERQPVCGQLGQQQRCGVQSGDHHAPGHVHRRC